MHQVDLFFTATKCKMATAVPFQREGLNTIAGMWLVLGEQEKLWKSSLIGQYKQPHPPLELFDWRACLILVYAFIFLPLFDTASTIYFTFRLFFYLRTKNEWINARNIDNIVAIFNE